MDGLKVSWQGAFVIVWARVVGAEDALASETLERQEVLTQAVGESAVLTNFTEFH